MIELKSKDEMVSVIVGHRLRVRLVGSYFEAGVGSVAPLPEFHGGASGLGVGGVVALARTALPLPAGDHFQTRHVALTAE